MMGEALKKDGVARMVGVDISAEARAAVEQYRRRLSIEGEPLDYFAMAGRKNEDVSRSFLESSGPLA